MTWRTDNFYRNVPVCTKLIDRLLPLRIMCGLGPMDPAPGVPVPSCAAAWPPPPEPFLWSRGVWAGVESRSFGLLRRKREKRKCFELFLSFLTLIHPTTFTAELFLLKVRAIKIYTAQF